MSQNQNKTTKTASNLMSPADLLGRRPSLLNGGGHNQSKSKRKQPIPKKQAKKQKKNKPPVNPLKGFLQTTARAATTKNQHEIGIAISKGVSCFNGQLIKNETHLKELLSNELRLEGKRAKWSDIDRVTALKIASIIVNTVLNVRKAQNDFDILLKAKKKKETDSQEKEK